MKKKTIASEEVRNTYAAVESKFKITRSAIKEMYEGEDSIKRNVNENTTASSNISSLTVDNFNSTYFSISNLEQIRDYSRDAYSFYPIYSTVVDTMSNIFYWRYVFYPRLVKNNNLTPDEYKTIYTTMAEVVDGLSIETTFPHLLTKLLIDGALFLITQKTSSSKTIGTMIMPPKYCRLASKTQFGTNTYQFDYSYFDNLGLNKSQIEEILSYYPQEMADSYHLYQKNPTKRWQKLNPKYAAGFSLNDKTFPTYLRSLGAILQYDKYRANELERSEQQLVKIISHKMPTWEDKLVVEVPEMKELHKSMSKQLVKNKYVRMLTTFGDLDVLSIGEDQTKENKTLSNAYSAIFNVDGDNENLFNGTNKESLEFSLRRKESIIWKYVQELVNFYNLVINNQFNFKGYQCNINMLPLSVYNFEKNLLQYKEGATLGVSRLEYIVSLGVKQIDIPSKIELETFLKLDELKPLSTSYTNSQNASAVAADDNSEVVEDTTGQEEQNIQTEVQNEQI